MKPISISSVLVIWIAVFCVGTDDFQFFIQFQPFSKAIANKATLGHNDQCKFTIEQKFKKMEQEILEKFATLSSASPLDVNQFTLNVTAAQQFVANISGSLCNTYKNLQCTSEGVCDCGEIELDGIKTNYQLDGDSCLVAPGSTCAPTDLLEQTEKSKNGVSISAELANHEAGCANKAPCVIKSSGMSCTLEAMVKAIQQELKSASDTESNVVKFIEKKVNEGFCVCEQKSISASSVPSFTNSELPFYDYYSETTHRSYNYSETTSDYFSGRSKFSVGHFFIYISLVTSFLPKIF